MREFTKYPYQVQFPHSGERFRNAQSLEDALYWAQHTVHARWHETNEYGVEGEYVYPDVGRAVVTNRNSGYRWIVRRERYEVEFQTAAMVEHTIASEHLDIHF